MAIDRNIMYLVAGLSGRDFVTVKRYFDPTRRMQLDAWRDIAGALRALGVPDPRPLAFSPPDDTDTDADVFRASLLRRLGLSPPASA